MSEDDLFGRLLKGFSRGPDKGSMNEYERKADGMAEDLRSALNRLLPKDPKFGYTPVQWAVRTSMKEIESFGALDSLTSELDADQLREISQQTGKSESELRKLYRVKGEKADRESVQSAYVIVECNIDHDNIENPFMAAQRFIHAVEEKVERHKPNHEDVSTDELTPLSHGQRPAGSGALFEAKYTFGDK